MSKIAEFIKSKNLNLTPEEVDGVKARLVFAGLDENMGGQDTAIASGLLDKIVEKMRQSKQNISDFVEQTSTLPKMDMFSEGANDGKTIMISLVNGRLASFNTQNNVVMPNKKTI